MAIRPIVRPPTDRPSTNVDPVPGRPASGRARPEDRNHHGDDMHKVLGGIHPLVFLIIATTLEVIGDAVLRIGIYEHVGPARAGLFLAGAALLFGYGACLNLAPLEFGRVVGLYIATLFVVWQIVNLLVFRALPTLPILVGGALIIGGGAITTFWKPA